MIWLILGFTFIWLLGSYLAWITLNLVFHIGHMQKLTDKPVRSKYILIAAVFWPVVSLLLLAEFKTFKEPLT